MAMINMKRIAVVLYNNISPSHALDLHLRDKMGHWLIACVFLVFDGSNIEVSAVAFVISYRYEGRDLPKHCQIQLICISVLLHSLMVQGARDFPAEADWGCGITIIIEL